MLKLDQHDGVLLFISNYVSSSFCYFGFAQSNQRHCHLQNLFVVSIFQITLQKQNIAHTTQAVSDA